MNDSSSPVMANEPQAETERLVLALREALTDSMVERITATAGNGLELLDRLNDQDTRDALHMVVDNVTDLYRIGALGTLFEVVGLIHAVRSAATDDIVERGFAFYEQIVNNICTEEMADLVTNLTDSMDGAVTDVKDQPQTGGLFSALSLLSKPESQQSLRFLLAIGGRLRETHDRQNG